MFCAVVLGCTPCSGDVLDFCVMMHDIPCWQQALCVQVIQQDSPCHLYLDLEYSKECNPGLAGDAMVQALIQMLDAGFR